MGPPSGPSECSRRQLGATSTVRLRAAGVVPAAPPESAAGSGVGVGSAGADLNNLLPRWKGARPDRRTVTQAGPALGVRTHPPLRGAECARRSGRLPAGSCGDQAGGPAKAVDGCARVSLVTFRGHALHFAAVSGDRIILEVKERGADQLGTRNVKRLRRQGLIPGVLYGKANKAFVVGERELRIALTGPSGLNGIVDVLIDGQKTPHHAVLKDYQQHPVRGTITHVDFHEVRLDQPIQATVLVHLVGESPGAKVGGVVQQVTRELNVEALPSDVPEYIEVDITGLELGESLRLQDVAAVKGVTFLDDPAETVVANCSSPRGLTEAEEAADEALAAEASAESAAAADAAAPDEE